MDQIIQTVEPVRQFAKDSIRLVKRCTKPDKKGMIYILRPWFSSNPNENVGVDFSLFLIYSHNFFPIFG